MAIKQSIYMYKSLFCNVRTLAINYVCPFTLHCTTNLKLYFSNEIFLRLSDINIYIYILASVYIYIYIYIYIEG